MAVRTLTITPHPRGSLSWRRGTSSSAAELPIWCTRMRKGSFLVVAALVVAALAPGTASAATATFGANLGRTPDNTATCTQLQLIPVAGTCTVESVNFATGESSFPPSGEGVVSAVRLRVGPTTGPMQIVLEEALRQDNPFEAGKPNYACCSVVDASPIFTPTANAITTVPVNFRVVQSLSPDSNGYFVDRHLALSILDPNVPIPASLSPNSSVGGWFPAWSAVGQQRVGPSGTFFAADVLMNADWDPIAAGGGGTVPAGLKVPRQIRPVRNNRAPVPLTCNSVQDCVGLLLLQNRQGRVRLPTPTTRSSRAKPKGKKSKARTITYAKVRFRVPAGKRKTVRAPFNRRGKLLLKRRASTKVWLNVKSKGTSVAPVKVKLKRPSGKRK